MSRSLKKGLFVDENLMKKIGDRKPGEGKPIQTYARSSTIIPEMVGFTIAVHNGKNFIDVLITEDMVGHKLGEFAPTRKFVVHGGKIAKAQAASAAEADREKLKAAQGTGK